MFFSTLRMALIYIRIYIKEVLLLVSCHLAQQYFKEAQYLRKLA